MANEIFFQLSDGKFWSPTSVSKIVASQRNTKFLKDFLRSKHNLTRERSQESDCPVKKALNYHVPYILVEKEFLLDSSLSLKTEHNATSSDCKALSKICRAFC